MNDFLSKLENFLFDILGLILPGAIFLLIFLSPVLFMDMTQPTAIDTPVIVTALRAISAILKENWTVYPKSALTIAIILAYLTGHTVKVFSIITYDFLAALFDESVNKLGIGVFNGSRDRMPLRFRLSKFYAWLKKIYKPFRTVIGDVFVFKANTYSDNGEIMTEYCWREIDSRLPVAYPHDASSVVKLSGIIANQESQRTLGTFFLAKYNLYRSLSLIFLFTTVYYIYFSRTASLYLTPIFHKISSIIFAAPAILWFTFHVKFKRYWKFYGQERVMSLFYFLNKKKLNEG